MEIGFNARFLMEMLSNLDAQEVKIRMSAPNRAGILVPSNSENENEDISKFKPLIKLYDRADIINDIA